MKSAQRLLIASLICALAAVAPRFAGAAAPLLPQDFQQLNHKSIFARQRATQSPDEQPRGPRPDPRPRPNYTPVLIGTMIEDDGYLVAFIEDPASGRMLSFIEGDALPNNAGTIKAITLDDVETSSATPGGPDKKIMVGQNILGGPAEYPNRSDSASSSDNSNNNSMDNRFSRRDRFNRDTNNNAPTPEVAAPEPLPPPASDGSSDDLITRLRKRRQAQIGG